MVRSYYPSECHADYFDFERIEALKPAIEACGISTLSQSPMLGFHKQMDNRIKLLEEILSFRMQGVEFDNGDMYVDGHKAASDVRDEFVFVTERLMDEMRQAHADGWFIVFDTLTLADDRLEAFYDNPNALRDYFRDIGRMVLAAEGRKANDSHADCYQYFCVPEYGTANGRLHFHAAKYVNKKSDMDLAAKGLGAKEWNNSLKTKLSLLPKKLFRIRMSRNFGMKMLTMTNLSTECLIQLTKLGYDATPFNQILKQNAKREMRLRLGKVTVADVLAAQPVTTNLLKFMRASIKMIGVSNLQSFIASMTQKLTLSDISDESKNYLDKAGITTACLRIKSKWTAGGK